MAEAAKASLVTRYVMFVLGVVTMAFGIALTVKANLGTASVSTVPTVLAFAGIGSVGVLSVVLNIVFLLLQIALLRRRFKWIQLLQIPTAFLFGYSIDGWLWLMPWLDLREYWQQAIVVVLGTVFLGIGVWLQVTPRVLIVPGEGLVLTISDLTRRRFGNVKIAFDVTLVLLAVILSLVLLHGLYGVREGTVFGALMVGNVVKWCHHLVPQYERWVSPRPIRE